MGARPIAVAAAAGVAALVFSACTGQTINGSPSAVTRPASGSPSGSGRSQDSRSGSSAPPPSDRKRAVTAFERAWSWTSPVGDSAAGVNATDAVAHDDTRAFVDTVTGNGYQLTSNRSYVTALDLRTGRQLWRLTFTGYVSHLQVVSGVLVLTYTRPVGRSDSSDSLVGLDPASGRQRWRYTAPIELPKSGPPLVIGSSLYVNVRVSAVSAYLHRVDARTGRSIAQLRSTAFGAPLEADGLLLLDNAGSGLAAVTPDLRKYAYKTVLADHRFTEDRIVDGILVRTDDSHAGYDAVYGHDPRTGRRLWSARLTWSEKSRTYSPTSTHLIIATSGMAVAVDARTGRSTWRVRHITETQLGDSGVAEGNVLACGRSLVSVDGQTGRVYGSAPLPSASYEDGCQLAPVAVDGQVLIASRKTVDAYRLTTKDDPSSAAGDGYGAWGPVDPENCGVDVTRTLAALKAVLGGDWRLEDAARTGPYKRTCGFARGTKDVTTRPLTTAQARRYLDRTNDDGGCADFGADTGSLHRVSVAGTDLPRGSGGCYQTGLSFGSYKASDFLSGLTRTKSGQWLAVEYEVAHNTAVATHQPAHLIALLKRFAA